MEFEYLKLSQATGREFGYFKLRKWYLGISSHGAGFSVFQATGMVCGHLKVSQATELEFEWAGI